MKKFKQLAALLVNVLFFAFSGISFSAPPISELYVEVKGNGIVSSNPAVINCPDDCYELLDRGTSVTLAAMPDVDSEFVGWSGSCDGTQSTCSLKINGQRTVIATFATISVDYPAPPPTTNIVNCYDTSGTEINCIGTGQDGEIQPGVAWPVPRFTDNGDGTVTDNLTGITWLKQADCYIQFGFSFVTWQEALDLAKQLGHGECGLTDGSIPGDWRLPSIQELHTLIDYRFGDAYSPALPNTEGAAQWSNGDPFIVLTSPNGSIEPNTRYWSSTTYMYNSTGLDRAWALQMSGTSGGVNKSTSSTTQTGFWPVKIK